MWQPTDLELHVYDVNDPAHPTRILHAELDGVFVATRRVGDRVYLVSRHSPFVPFDPVGRARLASMSLNDLLPKVTVAGPHPAAGRGVGLLRHQRCRTSRRIRS